MNEEKISLEPQKLVFFFECVYNTHIFLVVSAAGTSASRHTYTRKLLNEFGETNNGLAAAAAASNTKNNERGSCCCFVTMKTENRKSCVYARMIHEYIVCPQIAMREQQHPVYISYSIGHGTKLSCRGFSIHLLYLRFINGEKMVVGVVVVLLVLRAPLASSLFHFSRLKPFVRAVHWHLNSSKVILFWCNFVVFTPCVFEQGKKRFN